MDCEKFDQHVMDALYDELDELTYAALKRHVDGCSRCSGVWTGLRATREVGVLPVVQPSEGFEDRVLDAAFAAQRATPLRRKVLRGLAWAGSHAMRQELAMAALFLLVIGSSLLLLRTKPGTVASPLRVTESGAPVPDVEAKAEPLANATASAPANATPAATEAPLEVARKKEDVEAGGEKADAKALLAEARAARDRGGCAGAVGKFDEVAARFPATAAAADAMWDEASCYRALGQHDKAKELLMALKANASYRDRVEQELAESNVAMNNVQAAQPLPRLAARKAAAAPPPPAPAASPPAKAGGAKRANEAQADTNANASPPQASPPPQAAPPAPAQPQAPQQRAVQDKSAL